jgi:hypothetical protein
MRAYLVSFHTTFRSCLGQLPKHVLELDSRCVDSDYSRDFDVLSALLKRFMSFADSGN